VVVVALREIGVTLRSGLAPLTSRIPLPKAQPKAGFVPVVLVHGYLGHPEMLLPLARKLLEAGAPAVHRVSFPSTVWQFERIVEHIAHETRNVAQAHGTSVDLVGHSLGALASRAWLKLFDGHRWVRRFVSLGGPHGGTALHKIVPSPVRDAFDPEGFWVQRVSEGDEPVPTTNVRARYDHQVYPPQNAVIPGADEVVVDAWGHNGLLWSGEAHEAVVEALYTCPEDR
jgi:pimeloyl-ACP methyl ester carboxylesterase